MEELELNKKEFIKRNKKIFKKITNDIDENFNTMIETTCPVCATKIKIVTPISTSMNTIGYHSDMCITHEMEYYARKAAEYRQQKALRFIKRKQKKKEWYDTDIDKLIKILGG